ncbi:uncharacterized protein LOC130411982 isoform X2 [Triplophysa dalaica]|uniref:uncharacterized protein LOC130411982 isoform X2 n=1 Tax=Triplophysa dalaica TaxID=1582913 RepID=UPI0024E02D9C|nr:uncharacterized protein LOC130411982 isoform X2 [Triplophysa dalaica]
MKTSKCLALAWCVLILPYLIVAQHRVINVQRGTSVNISCNYNISVDIEVMHASLTMDKKKCFYYINTTSQINQSCKDFILFWFIETKKIKIQLSNLQINDSGTYKCTLERQIPPPSVNLGIDQTTVQVVANPNVSISCIKEPEEFSIILCSSEGFYPSDLQQVWLKHGEFHNISKTHNTNRTNPDGSSSLHSYLNVSSAMSDSVNYSCWVNHSSLNKPVVLHLSLDDCYERKNRFSHFSDNMKIVLVISALLILIILIITVVLKRFERTNRRYPISSESVRQSHPQLEVVYSMLGDHHPNPCSNRRNQGLVNSISTLNND